MPDIQIEDVRNRELELVKKHLNEYTTPRMGITAGWEKFARDRVELRFGIEKLEDALTTLRPSVVEQLQPIALFIATCIGPTTLMNRNAVRAMSIAATRRIVETAAQVALSVGLDVRTDKVASDAVAYSLAMEAGTITYHLLNDADMEVKGAIPQRSTRVEQGSESSTGGHSRSRLDDDLLLP